MASTNPDLLVYSGPEVPLGGFPGEVLLKTGDANYYSGWRSLTDVFQRYDIVLDDGEY